MSLKEEEVDNDKPMTFQDSRHQIDNNKQPDDKRLLHFGDAKKDMEVESKELVLSLQSQLTDSYKKMQEMEYQSNRLKATLREKDDKWQKSLSRLLKGTQDLRWAQLDAKEEILRLQFDWKDQLKNFGEELQTLVAAASGYHKVLAENRQLYNEVQDLKGNIRVYCRVRPFLTKDSTKQTTIDYIGENGELVLANPGKPVGKDSRRSFTFNRCFDTKSLQEEVFLDTQPLIRSVLDGFNVCIFAYGQTGSGKTFTMSGPTNMTPTNWGVNYRALNDLFEITQTRVHVFRYEIGVQMLEIYNEQVRDLLVTDGSHKKLEIRNNSQLNGLNVPDANIMPVTSTDDVLELMKLGQKNRAVGSTSLNDRSSRSHSVVTVHVQGKDLESGSIFRGSLHLVDLAGSERVDKSEVTGDRLKEAQHINKSLSALGDVISALAQKNGHVPYRNSKLTQLLQDSLGGQAKTLMFVHISPDADSFGETMSTLKFAERVATVELGAARSNKESGEIQILKDQVYQLKEVVAKRDAEIAILNNTIKEQLEKADNIANTEKVKGKPTNASKPRRRTSNEAQAQKGRKTTTENGNANAENRQSMRKIPGDKKTPSSLVLSTGHDPEDSTEHFESSSACSPLDSPTENKVQFEEAGLVFDTTTPASPSQPERNFTCQELNDTFQSSGDDTLSSFQDYTQQLKTDSNGRYVAGAKKYDVVAEMGRSNQQSGLRLRPPSNMVYGQDLANGSFETVLLDTIGGQNAQDTGCKRGSFLLNSDVGLDEDFGDEEAFESRGTCQDDTASLYSDSGMSAEAENSGSVDQNKKVRPNSIRPQKGMFQSEVSLTPVTSTSRASPSKAERKLTGGLGQVRPRKHKTVGPAAASDKPPPKRNAPLTGNANQEVDPASNRRSSIGVASLTTWR
ncbi:hypothetical protein KC19_12G109900 [Ceratodon purpureus]|uniref:Kinesin-like protein n=1 Tax=Ceratodon purpureus TaxID=3225 RepID=A0A8T0G9J6_CERPU|nr:hypothetical protein KC19_12G109900 [Ceratodon purpureus]